MKAILQKRRERYSGAVITVEKKDISFQSIPYIYPYGRNRPRGYEYILYFQ